MISNFEFHDAHSPSQITKIAFTDLTYRTLASIAYDSHIRLWDLPTFTIKQEMSLNQSYLFALLPTPEGFLVGNGDGELTLISRDGNQIVRKAKFHTDCLTDILEEEDHYVTVGYDGTVNFIDKRQFAVMKTLKLDSCMEQIVAFKGKYYVAGNKGYQISESLEVKEKNGNRRYLATRDHLYATNDDKGFSCQSKKKNSYVPCEAMVEVESGVVGTSWSTISHFQHEEDGDRIVYRSARITQMVQGDSVLSLLNSGQRIFAAAESGNIYSFKLNSDYCWYD